MKHVPRAQAAQIQAAIAATPAATTSVWVMASHAHLFRRVAKDGRQYVVQDPDSRNILHCTSRDGRYERVDASKLTIQVETRRKGAKRKAAPPRLAGRGDLAGVRATKPQATPEISLIDLQRVTLICGFKKSFIYDREDFPKPIRLGTAQRSAVRWIEHEVIEWVRGQVAARDLALN